MKNTHRYILFLLVGLSIQTSTNAQYFRDQKFKENIWLTTDRNLFVVGESVFFSAYVYRELSDTNALSKILYVQLIDAEGNAMDESKFLIEKNRAHGCLAIPDAIVSGYYYICAYTKNMRNAGPVNYKYIPLKIVNPQKSDVYESKEMAKAKDSMHIIPEFDSISSETLFFNSKRQTYKKREEVKVLFSTEKLKSTRHIAFTVVPEASLYRHELFLSGADKDRHSEEIYFPETRGISLSGKLVEEKTNEKIANSKVNLSIIGTGQDFMATITDSLGRYFFALPNYAGSKDLFLCSEELVDKTTKILVDNDYSPIDMTLPSPVFGLTEKERKTAYQLAVNTTVQQHYSEENIVDSVVNNKHLNAFYGLPSKTLFLDQYIDLPSIEEYFIELSFMVKIRKRGGKKYFKVQGENSLMEVYDPLVLIDFVAIENMKSILSIQPKGIDRIEVVNEPYVKGDITYGGIVSFISKEANFAGIDLPSSGMFINYDFLSDCEEFTNYVNHTKNFPDARNTLYWNPSLDLFNSQTISFLSGDTPGNYVMVLKGIDNQGKEFMQSVGFKVID
jgi:hypothetical protein